MTRRPAFPAAAVEAVRGPGPVRLRMIVAGRSHDAVPRAVPEEPHAVAAVPPVQRAETIGDFQAAARLRGAADGDARRAAGLRVRGAPARLHVSGGGTP